MMELLPPVGWADVATKQDLSHLETVMSIRFEAVDRRLDAVDRRFDAVDHRFDVIEDRLESRFDDLSREIRAQAWKMVTVGIAVAGTVAAAVRL